MVLAKRDSTYPRGLEIFGIESTTQFCVFGGSLTQNDACITGGLEIFGIESTTQFCVFLGSLTQNDACVTGGLEIFGIESTTQFCVFWGFMISPFVSQCKKWLQSYFFVSGSPKGVRAPFIFGKVFDNFGVF